MRKHITSIVIAATLFGLSISAGHAATAAREGAGDGASPLQGTGAKRQPANKVAPKAHRKVKLGPLHASPQVTNPAAGAQSAIIAVLQKQRQAADAEAVQMKLGIVPQAKPTATITGKAASAPRSITMQKTSPGTIGPEKTMDSTSVAKQIAPQFVGTAIVCAKDPTMRILTVSGESAPATFTSDDRFNFYTIVGCSFGDPGPNSKVYIYYQNTFRQDFQIQEWNENGIKLSLKPNLTGLLDHDNLTLVVQRADGKEATKAGFKFYAARETKPLKYFPRDQFSLWQLTLNDISHLEPEYASPSAVGTPDGGQPGIPGYAAEVYWRCTNCGAVLGRSDNVYMQGNEDVWQLKNLYPGFVVQSYGMGYRDLDCSGSYVSMNKEGAFGLKMVGTELHAQWQGQTCVEAGCGGTFQGDCFNYSGSNYLINIIVSGPRGIDPWSGKPTP